MSEEQPASLKKEKKKRKEANGHAVAPAEPEVAHEAAEVHHTHKKAHKSKKDVEGSHEEEPVAEEGASETNGVETKKKKKKKAKKAHAEDGEHPDEEKGSTLGELPPPRVGPVHDKDVPGVVETFATSVVKARTGNTHGLAEDINIERFIQAFHDLLPILRLLGTAFYFVEQDIVQKLTAIQENQAKQKDQPFARNIIDFIDWEKENNPKMRTDKHTSARHTLRLMRALHFIGLFLERLNTPGVEPKPAGKEAYAVSLAQFHPWTVRTAVSVAFYTLPSRKSFMKELHLDHEAPDVFADFVTAANHIRTTLNLYYDANDWQNLP